MPALLLAQTADEAALRALVGEFYAAYQREDTEPLRALWSAQSPDLAKFIERAQQTFAAADRIEVQGITVRKLSVAGGVATVRVAVELSAVDVKTGKPAAGLGKLNYTFRFVKEKEGWKVCGHVASEEVLAAALVAAETEQERGTLLEADKELQTVVLRQALLEQGNQLRLQGEYAQAHTAYRLAQRLAEQVDDKAGVARALNNAGSLYVAQSEHAQALECYQQSLAISEALKDKPGLARTLHNIGLLYALQGDGAQALKYYERSLALRQELDDKAGIASSLNNIGTLHLGDGNLAQALENFQKSIPLYEASGNMVGRARALGNVAWAYQLQGNYAQALAGLQQVLKQFESLNDKEDMAEALNLMASTYYAQGKYAQAAAAAERASAFRLSGNNESYLAALMIAGRAYHALGQLEQARQAFTAGVDFIEKRRPQLAGGEQARQHFLTGRLYPYHGLTAIALAQGQTGEALAYAERAKARVLLEVLSGGRVNITKAMSAQEQAQERRLKSELVSLNSQIARESIAPQPDQARLVALKTRLQQAHFASEDFQAKLYAVHPELRVQRGELPPVTFEEAAALLPDAQTAALEYVVAEGQTFLFVLTKEEPRGTGARPLLKAYTINTTQKDLTAQVGAFRQLLAERNAGYRAPAHALYDLLLGPAARQLRGKTALIIVPDGALWELPFQALLTAENRHLLENYALSYAPSLTALREMTRVSARRRASGRSSTLLAVGNPTLSREPVKQARLTRRTERLDPLSEAEQEVTTLGRLYGRTRSRVYTGAQAREEVVKAEAGKYRVLHLATHGILNEAEPLYSRVLLAQVGNGSEDGLLEAWELMNLDLQAELVVLSACETARGRVSAGEGMIGLSWALFVAGVPAVVVSQWRVESASTTELMIEFHRQLLARGAGHVSRAEALRRAARKLLQRDPGLHPFYWAAFVVVGDGA